MPGEQPAGGSDSEFELTLDDGPLEEGGQHGTVIDYSIDGASDADLALDESYRWPPTHPHDPSLDHPQESALPTEAEEHRAALHAQMPAVRQLIAGTVKQTTLEPDLQTVLVASVGGLFEPLEDGATEEAVVQRTDAQFRSLRGRLLEVHTTLQQRGVLADAQFAGLINQIAAMPGLKGVASIFPELARRSAEHGDGQPMLYLGAYKMVDSAAGDEALAAFEQRRIALERQHESERVAAELKKRQGGTVAQVCGCCNDGLH